MTSFKYDMERERQFSKYDRSSSTNSGSSSNIKTVSDIKRSSSQEDANRSPPATASAEEGSAATAGGAEAGSLPVEVDTTAAAEPYFMTGIACDDLGQPYLVQSPEDTAASAASNPTMSFSSLSPQNTVADPSSLSESASPQDTVAGCSESESLDGEAASAETIESRTVQFVVEEEEEEDLPFLKEVNSTEQFGLDALAEGLGPGVEVSYQGEGVGPSEVSGSLQGEAAEAELESLTVSPAASPPASTAGDEKTKEKGADLPKEEKGGAAAHGARPTSGWMRLVRSLPASRPTTRLAGRGEGGGGGGTKIYREKSKASSPEQEEKATKTIPQTGIIKMMAKGKKFHVHYCAKPECKDNIVRLCLRGDSIQFHSMGGGGGGGGIEVMNSTGLSATSGEGGGGGNSGLDPKKRTHTVELGKDDSPRTYGGHTKQVGGDGVIMEDMTKPHTKTSDGKDPKSYGGHTRQTGGDVQLELDSKKEVHTKEVGGRDPKGYGGHTKETGPGKLPSKQKGATDKKCKRGAGTQILNQLAKPSAHLTPTELLALRRSNLVPGFCGV